MERSDKSTHFCLCQQLFKWCDLCLEIEKINSKLREAQRGQEGQRGGEESMECSRGKRKLTNGITFNLCSEQGKEHKHKLVEAEEKRREEEEEIRGEI